MSNVKAVVRELINIFSFRLFFSVVGSVKNATPSNDLQELKNQTAIEAITEKLTEVTNLAEEVDQALQSAHQDCAISTTSSSTSTATTTISVDYLINNEITPTPTRMMMMNEEVN